MRYLALISKKKSYIFTLFVYLSPGFLLLGNLWIISAISSIIVAWAYSNTKMFAELKDLVNLVEGKFIIYFVYCVVATLVVYFYPDMRSAASIILFSIMLYIGLSVGNVMDEQVNKSYEE